MQPVHKRSGGTRKRVIIQPVDLLLSILHFVLHLRYILHTGSHIQDSGTHAGKSVGSTAGRVCKESASLRLHAYVDSPGTRMKQTIFGRALACASLPAAH
jgi:hypothetical protein